MEIQKGEKYCAVITTIRKCDLSWALIIWTLKEERRGEKGQADGPREQSSGDYNEHMLGRQ